MAEAIFKYNQKEIKIECKKNEVMKDICQKFANKALISLNNVYFLFSGDKLDLKLTFEKITKDNKITILAVDDNKNDNKEDIIEEECKKKGKEILQKHLDGRSYKESKVDEWINRIFEEFIIYFKQNYPSYNIFLFCYVCPKNNLFFWNKRIISIPKKEKSSFSLFETDKIYSILYFFFFNNFTSNQCLSLEPKIISFGNKLLYEIFDERHYEEKMSDYCERYNKELLDYILKLDKSKKYFSLIFAFKKPLKDLSYNYTTTWPYQLSKIIPTFFTPDTEIIEYLFIFSNDKMGN